MAEYQNYDKTTGFLHLGRLISPIFAALIVIAVMIYGFGANPKLAMMAGLAVGVAEYYTFSYLISRLENFRK